MCVCVCVCVCMYVIAITQDRRIAESFWVCQNARNFNATNWLDFQQILFINYSTISENSFLPIWKFLFRCFEALVFDLKASVASGLWWTIFGWINFGWSRDPVIEPRASQYFFTLFLFYFLTAMIDLMMKSKLCYN
jgi:hypothetical protein